jgi:hypothetical protein
MNRFKKLAMTAAALGALAVGGAAFASAQSSSSTAPAPIHRSSTEAETPGDNDGGQAAEQNEKGQDAAEAAPEADQSGGHQEASDGDGESRDG